MSTCEREAQASAFLDGELPDEEHRAFEEHLATCIRCPQVLTDFVELDAVAHRAMAARQASAWGQLGLVAGLVLALFALAVTGMVWSLSDAMARAAHSAGALTTPARAPVPAPAGDRPSPSPGGAR